MYTVKLDGYADLDIKHFCMALMWTCRACCSLSGALLSLHSTIQLTYADFALVAMIGGIVTSAGFAASLDKFPKIHAHQQAVESLPNIKQWIEKRPQTEY